MKLAPLKPIQGLAEMVSSATFRALRPIEATIYLRLLSLSAGSDEPIRPLNRDLYRDPTTTTRVLEQLKSYGLIKIVRGPRARKVSSVGREIMVVR